jgi:hypothetical protein
VTNHTGKRRDVRNNSGLPVYPSGPGLGVGRTTPPTAGRKPAACPPDLGAGVQPALSQHKKGPEVQEPGGFLGAREASPSLRSEAEQASSLVPNKNNRYTQRPEGRGKHCARWTLKGIDLRTPRRGTPNVNRYWRLNCNCWECSYCGPIKAKRYKAAIRDIAERFALNKFLTLTLDPKRLSKDEDPIRYIKSAFADFRVYLFRKFKKSGKKINYISVLELHQGGGENHGKPHLHILLDTYIDQRWISEAWQAVGGGHRVWIEQVSVKNASRYLSKYLSKEMLLSAPKKTRRITCSRSITLMPRLVGPKHYRWMMRKLPIQFLYEFLSTPDLDQFELFQIIDVSFDSEEFLQAFAIVVNSDSGANTTLTLGVFSYVGNSMLFVWQQTRSTDRQERKTVFHLRSMRNSTVCTKKTRNRTVGQIHARF